MLLDSLFIITAAVHRGNVAGYIKATFTVHFQTLKHTHRHTHTHTHTHIHTHTHTHTDH